jgi:hypothetical protein
MLYLLLFEKKGNKKIKKREKWPGGFFPGQASPMAVPHGFSQLIRCN